MEKSTSIQAGGNVVRGTWGAAIVEGVEVAEGEYVLERQRMNAFHGTQLNVMLRNLGVDTVIICGAWTNMAVEHTARSAADYGYCVVFASDATSTFNDQWQQASLNYALTDIATLASTAEIEAALRTTRGKLLTPPVKGTYTFKADIDDKARLKIGNQQVFECLGYGEAQGTIELEPNRLYDLELVYYQDVGPARIKLRWS